MDLVSLPRALTLPDKAAYPLSELFLFYRHNRLTWERAFGEQAEPWDKGRRIQRWADTSVKVPEGKNPTTFMVEYSHFDRVSRTFKTFKLSAADAMTPNLPGEYVYPKYVVAPTNAVVTGGAVGDEPLHPRVICLMENARFVARELGGEVIENSGFSSGPFIIDWRGEVRRRWLIQFENITCNAAALIQDRYREGIGNLGEWTWVQVGPHKEPRWQSYEQLTGERDDRPEIPIPCRQLFPIEAIFVGQGGVSTIYRKDMESPYSPAPQSSGGLTPGQAVIQREIRKDVRAICRELEVD